jgi:hypothetical protein
VQQRFPIGWNFACRPRRWLVFGMRMRRKQFRTLDHLLRFVVVEPILTRFEAGNDRMASCRRMLGRVLAGRTVAATDVPTLRTAAEMEPPAFRRGQAFDAAIAAGLGGGVDSALIFFHFQFSLRAPASEAGIERVRPATSEVRNEIKSRPSGQFAPDSSRADFRRRPACGSRAPAGL